MSNHFPERRRLILRLSACRNGFETPRTVAQWNATSVHAATVSDPPFSNSSEHPWQRAIILEELIVAFVYGNAKERMYYRDIAHLDSEMLSTVKRIVRHLEVGVRRTKDWEDAIFQGYAAFRHLLEKREAVLHLDLKRRKLTIVK